MSEFEKWWKKYKQKKNFQYVNEGHPEEIKQVAKDAWNSCTSKAAIRSTGDFHGQELIERLYES